MNTISKTLWGTVFAISATSSTARAQTIDFESPPVVGLWGDNVSVDTQFALPPYNVTFELEGGGSPVLAEVGGQRSAFLGKKLAAATCGVNSSTQADMPTVNANAGCFFLTDDGLVGSSAPPIQPLRIRYLVPVLQASGNLLDVDNNERFLIEAFGSDDSVVIGSVLLQSSDSNAGNGEASFWALDLSEPIHSILITSIPPAGGGSATKGIGFDNFSASTVCPELVEYYGFGLPGIDGFEPAISVGCPEIGSAGSIDIFNGEPGAVGLLIIGTAAQSVDFAAGKLFVVEDRAVLHRLNGPLGISGQGHKSFSYQPLDPSLAGISLFFQTGYLDSGAAQGISLSRAVQMRL